MSYKKLSKVLFYGLLTIIIFSLRAKADTFNLTGEYSPDSNTILLCHFNEGEGQIVRDESSCNNNGTLGESTDADIDDPTWVPGKFGTGLLFDGIDDIVPFGNAASLDIPPEGLTIELWFYVYSMPIVWPALVDKQQQYDIGIRGTDAQLGLNFRVDGVLQTLMSNTYISLKQWYHVAVIIKSGDQRIFINGKQVAAATYSGSFYTGRPLSLSPSMYPFYGIIDEFRISKTIPTALVAAAVNVKKEEVEKDYFELLKVISKGRMDDSAFKLHTGDKEFSGSLGLNLVVLDENNWQIVESRSFAPADKEASDKLADFIQTLPEGSYVVAGIKGEGVSNMTERAYQALESLGSRDVRYIQAQDSWAMIGKKGALPGSVPEELAFLGTGGVSLTLNATRHEDKIIPLKGQMDDKFLSALKAYHGLVALIKEAKGKGIDTAYYDLAEVVSDVAIEVAKDHIKNRRWDEAEQKINYALKECGGAEKELREIFAGKRKERKVPNPQMIGIHAKDGFFYNIDNEPIVLFGPTGDFINTAYERKFGNNWFPRVDMTIPRRAGFNLVSGWTYMYGSWQVKEYLDKARENNLTVILQAAGYLTTGAWPGFFFDLENPEHRALQVKFTEEYFKDRLSESPHHPALHSYMMFNEAWYYCECDRSIEMFKEWARGKYGKIEKANQLWDTNYTDFQEADPPKYNIQEREIEPENRAMWYDWMLFNKWRTTEFFKWAKKDITRVVPDIKFHIKKSIGIALYGFGSLKSLDCEEVANEVEDYNGNDGTEDSFLVNYLRLMAPEKPLINTEFYAEGDRNNFHHGTRSKSWEFFIHGGSAATMFIWQRQFPTTCLEYQPERLEEFGLASLELRRCAAYIKDFHNIKTQVALLFSNDTNINLDPCWFTTGQMQTPFHKEVKNFYEGTPYLDTPIDVITESVIKKERFMNYKLLLIPSATSLNQEIFERICEFVEKGGRIVVTPASFRYNEYHKKATYLDRIGIKVLSVEIPHVDFVGGYKRDPLLQIDYKETTINEVEKRTVFTEMKDIFKDKRLCLKTGGGISEKISAPAYQVLAKFTNGYPAISVREMGKGKIYYLASSLEPESMFQVLDLIMDDGGVERKLRVENEKGEHIYGIEARMVDKADEKYVYLNNFNDRKVKVKLNLPYQTKEIVNAMNDKKMELELELDNQDPVLLILK